MKRNIKLAMALAVSMIFALSVTAYAGKHGKGGPHGKGGMMGFPFLQSLSEDQKPKVAEIFAKYKDEMDQRRDASAAAMEKVADAVHADTFNEADIRQAFKEASAAKEEMVVLRAKILSEIKPLLTPEQIAKMKERKERMKDRRECRDSMAEDWIEDNTK